MSSNISSLSAEAELISEYVPGSEAVISVDNARPFDTPTTIPTGAKLRQSETSLIERIKPTLDSDESLAAMLCNGDNEALSLLFARYNLQIRRQAKRILKNSEEAEDLVQHVFLNLLRSIEQYDPQKGSFRTWLVMFAYCQAMNRRQKLQSRHYYDSASFEDVVPGLLEGAQQLLPMQQAEVVCLAKQALGLIQPRQRAVIEAIYYEGRTPEEVAQQTGESVGTVRHCLYRGLKKLRQALVQAEGPKRLPKRRQQRSRGS